ncbi:outer membrane protein with beta-barrel domain [Tenacibaculum lutimaris]|uniref:Outer membrane protein with beta-barrel domain n=1 Tax=Tenacibaculum lutimaris TaxID=285258 RepID=A0A420E4Y2_9FLAO|nr:outer membrane beta-barrel protein [Tenacibaculum lutimaris]RKF05112.1 outer membrane protein with beta-barrel domain [Tenacibaculum lutimaris]
MMEEKNIDRLFQERFKDLEVTPNEKVWSAIEEKLQKKKKHRVFPIWWFSGVVAAVFVLGLLLYPYIDKQENLEKIDPVIVESESLKPEENKKDDLKDILLTEPIKENSQEIVIVKEETKKKRIFKEKLHENEVLTANHVVKVSKKELQGKDSNNIASKVVEGALLAKNDVVKQEQLTGKLENSLPVFKKKENTFLKKENDTINKVLKPKKDFLAVVNEEKVENEEEEKKKSWSVSPTVAILNSNSFSESSPIDASLSNSTKGNTSYSYGVQVAYQLNKKWTLQSGIHLQEMGYSNTNVAVNPVKSSSSNVVFSSGESYSLNDTSQTDFSTSSVSISSGSLDGELNQKYGYVEVPVQIKYNFLEGKKLKTELVVGFSSLFLNKNDVTLNTTNFSTSGEANNLNSINFSGNLGVDLNYKFSKKWSLNINPMLKTQLNTFKNDSNGFQPYFIGVYTGLNYQF